MTFIINQLILAFFNYVNSRIDAYRIFRDKAIAHGINFSAYAIFSLLLYYISVKPTLTWAEFPYIKFLIYCVSALCNRQLSFDIPLNLRRGLDWFYQSVANPPKALMDKIERKLFGVDYDGKKIVVFYAIMWCISVGFNFIK